MRRPGYEAYKFFPARQRNACSVCGKALIVGTPVLGAPLGHGKWDIVCLDCGNREGAGAQRGRPTTRTPRRRPSTSTRLAVHSHSPQPGNVAVAVDPSKWATLVRYLLACVQRESQVTPVKLKQHELWAVLPLAKESLLCGNDLGIPPLPQVLDLFADLRDMEAVFYGWPTVVAADEHGELCVAPLFLRPLETPQEDAAGAVSVGEMRPQVNLGLLTRNLFSPELVASAISVIPDGPIGFGRSEAVVTTAQELLHALGLPATSLDPSALFDGSMLRDPWRPQEAGVYNLVMTFRGALDAATRSLIKDLQQMEGRRDWMRSAARLLFERVEASSPSLAKSCAIELNDSQERSLASAATAALTVITGPPGTGKSQTVAAIVADAWLRGESVLLASTNNAPIDSVIEDKMAQVDEALMLRTGNTTKQQEMVGILRDLIVRVRERPPREAAPSLPAATLAYHGTVRLLEERARMEQDVLASGKRRDEMRAMLASVVTLPPEHLRDRIGAIGRKAAATRWRWLRRRRARACLALAGVPEGAMDLHQVLDWVVAEETSDKAFRDLQTFNAENPDDPFQRFSAARDSWRAATAAALHTRVRDGYLAGAEVLDQLVEAKGSQLRRETIGRAMSYVKGWATSALSTRPNFTCQSAVIDLVIIDEASQCNLAQVLPLAYRAKRLVIVGDPKQLSPIVKIGADDLRDLAARAGVSHESLAVEHLTFGADSAYSAFANRLDSEPYLLEEHYRCHPDIIRFCNRHFYDSQLVVLTRIDDSRDGRAAFEWRDVQGRTDRGGSGGVVNIAEAEAVSAWVLESGLSPDRIGVVTPFREQANLVSQLLRRGSYSDVRVGTAHTFQGSECDYMVFSTVLSTGANPGTAAWVEAERNLINVAVSRARKHLTVFGNRTSLARLGATTLLRLAEEASATSHGETPPSTVVRRLYGALLERGLPATLGGIEQGYAVAITLDCASGGHIDVEVSEFPEGDPRGKLQRQLAARDENLRRLGWIVVRVPGWKAYLEPKSVSDELWRLATTA